MEKVNAVFVPPANSDLMLLPCPFCGNTKIVYERYETLVGDRWRVFCGGCCATIDPGYAQQRCDVAVLWNHRAEQQAQRDGDALS